MAISSASLAAAMPAMFGNIKPALDLLKKLGYTDFSADAPEYEVKAGSTIKIPISSVAAALAFHSTNNNYTTGGTTGWATLTATHYLQGFDISGADVDGGHDLNRMKQLFTARAGLCIAAACMSNLVSAIGTATASQVVTLGTIGAQSGAPTLNSYMTLGDSVKQINKAQSVLAVNATLLADIKAKLAAAYVVPASLTEAGQYLGFRDMVLVPGMTARAFIVPQGSCGFLGRVPKIIARYIESGVETDDDTGLSVGIVVADDQSGNRQIANADLWFGTAVQTATESGGAITAGGAIKIS